LLEDAYAMESATISIDKRTLIGSNKNGKN
jgi:hypothetical protein